MPKTVTIQYEWGVIEWLAGSEVGIGHELSVARMTLPATNGTTLHVHDNCEESVYVTNGTVECTAGDLAVILGPGELAVVMRGDPHSLRNVGSVPAEMLLSYSSASREFRLAPGG